MQKQRGFTLLELMISIAIVGVIASMALPSYRQSVLKANRTDAYITMAGLATQQEKFYFSHNRYAEDFSEIIEGVESDEAITSDEGLYSITLAGTSTGWEMEATAIGDQAKDYNCARISLTSLGVKTSHNSDDAATTDCWR